MEVKYSRKVRNKPKEGKLLANKYTEINLFHAIKWGGIVMINEKFYNLQEEKRKKILDSAMKQFSENSYNSASTAEIAKDAGISKAILFYYFHNKEELYEYLVNEIYRKKIDELIEVDKNAVTDDFFELRLRNWRAHCDFAKENPYFEGFFSNYHNNERHLKNIGDTVDLYNRVKKFTLKTANLKKFREDVDINLVYEITCWAGRGYMDDSFNFVTANAEIMFERYRDILYKIKKLVYKEEYL